MGSFEPVQVGLDDCRVFVIPVISEGCDGEGQVLQLVRGCGRLRHKKRGQWSFLSLAVGVLRDPGFALGDHFFSDQVSNGKMLSSTFRHR